MLAIVVGAGSGIGGLARVDFGVMSNRVERSRTGPNVAPGGLSLRLDLVEHQAELTPCSAAGLRPEARAAARQSVGTFRFHGLVRFLKIGFGSTLVVDSTNALSPRFAFLPACAGPPTVVRIPDSAERLHVSRNLNRGEIFQLVAEVLQAPVIALGDRRQLARSRLARRGHGLQRLLASFVGKRVAKRFYVGLALRQTP